VNSQRTSSLPALKRVAQLSLICLASFFLVKTVLIASRAQSPDDAGQERKLELKTFKDIPVSIHKVKNLNSNSWHKDLEIEIKNVSDKPIYFMLAYLTFPDQPVPPGGVAGIRLMYGDPKKNGLIDNYANPEDEHLKPGEIYVFTIPEIDRKGLATRDKKFPQGNKNFVLEFAIINFGDRTGFEAGRSLDLRRRSFALPLGEQIFRKASWNSSTTRTAAQDGCGAQSPDDAGQERKLELKTFKDIPVSIHKVKNLNSNSWHKDLEIEIKNVSDKPIYFMLVYLVFPDDPVPPGGESGIPLVYGDPEINGNIAKYANPEDEHLNPGETYIFTVPELFKKGLRAKHEKFPERAKNLVLKFAIINFGDGTGFEAGRSLDLRRTRSALSPPEKQVPKNIRLSHSTSTSTLLQDSCGGGNCFRWFVNPTPVSTSCSCALTRVAIISLDRPCSHLTSILTHRNEDAYKPRLSLALSRSL
jgi:hypothetical protein